MFLTDDSRRDTGVSIWSDMAGVYGKKICIKCLSNQQKWSFKVEVESGETCLIPPLLALNNLTRHRKLYNQVSCYFTFCL
jgi:hypothetical protein